MLEKVKLGNTGLEVNRICLGCGSFGGTVNEENANAQMDYFRAHGGIFLDTAVVYTDWYEGERSASQHFIGRWLKKHNCRHEMTLSVKGCNPDIITPTNNMATATRTGPRVGRKFIVEDIERSMQNLGTDYLDIFTLHKDDESVPVAEILETLQEQKARGVIRAYGCSNWRVPRQREAYAYAKAHGLDGFCIDQTRWCLNHYAPTASGNKTDAVMDAASYAFHRESGIGVMAYGANGRGYFQNVAHGIDVRAADHKEYDCPENDAILAVLKQASAETGAEVNTLVLRYLLLDHGFQTVPIIGCKTIGELEMNLAAMDAPLPDVYAQKLQALRPLA